MDDYTGHLVVLRSRWNIRSNEVGVVVETSSTDRVTVMWTTERGIELKVHIKDALIPVTSITNGKIMERICDIT
jgi:hypothetical protein